MISGGEVTIKKGSALDRKTYPFKVTLTSIPHSGTQFFDKLIKPTAFTHVTDQKRIYSLMDESEVVLMAVRHPQKIWESWWHRREGLGYNDTKPGDEWYRAWSCFNKVVEYRRDNMYFLPIDHQLRDLFVAIVGKRLDRKFEPNWDDVVNQRKRDRGTPPEIDLTDIFRIPVIRDLYATQSDVRTQQSA